MKRVFADDSPYWSTAQVAQYLCCTKAAAIKLAEAGVIPAPLKLSARHWLWDKNLIRQKCDNYFASEANGTGINNNTPEGGN